MTISLLVESLTAALEQEIYFNARTDKDFVVHVDCSEKIILRLIDSSYCNRLHIQDNNDRHQRLFQT